MEKVALFGRWIGYSFVAYAIFADAPPIVTVSLCFAGFGVFYSGFILKGE